MLCQLRQQRVVVTALDRAKPARCIIENNVEADRGGARLIQTVEQLCVIGTEKDAWRRLEQFRRETALVDGNDRDPGWCRRRVRWRQRERDIVEKAVDELPTTVRGNGKRGTCDHSPEKERVSGTTAKDQSVSVPQP